MKKYYVSLAAVSLIFLIACNRSILKIEPSGVCDKENTMIDTIYTDFITASRNLDIPYLNKTAANEAQRKYANALQLLMERQDDSAEALLFDLVNSSTDTLIRNESKSLLETVFLAESKWANLIKIHPQPENSTDIYFTHSKAWSNCNPTEYRFPVNGITVPLKFTRNGQPLVQVMINGKSYWFIIDTGGQFSVVSKNVADECGVHPILVEGTDSESMFSNPGIVSDIAIGEAKIRNVPVMIIESKNLDLKLLGLITLMKIDGIIGWPQLKNLRLEFNYVQSTLRISKSSQSNTKDGNFFFYFRPLIKASASNGAPLFFWFDTGNGQTSLFPRGARKTNIDITRKGFTASSMATHMGGTTIQQKSVLKNAGFCIREIFLRFDEIQIEKADNPFFDGWMGMDICINNKLIIDYLKGEILIQNP